MKLSTKEARYWRLRASLQELLGVSDEDIERNPDLKNFLDIVSNVALIYKEKGADYILEQNRRKDLEATGVIFLDSKRKKK